MEDKYTQSANETRAIDKANGRKNGARKDVRPGYDKRHLLEASTFEKVRISIFYIR